MLHYRIGLAVLLAVSILVCPARARGAAPPPQEDPLPARALVRIGSPHFRHGGLVRSLAFSPLSGRTDFLLASASHDHTISIWQCPSGRERYRLHGHDSDVLSVSFSSDGTLLASGGGDGTLRLWSLDGKTAGQEVDRLTIPGDAVEAVAFEPKGHLLAAGGGDGVIRLFDVKVRKVIRSILTDRSVRALAWSPDGKFLASTGAKSAISLWNPATGKPIRHFGEELVQALSWSLDGKLLASWDGSGTVSLWRPTTGEMVGTWKENGDTPRLTYQLTFSPDSQTLYTGSTKGIVSAWQVSTGKRRQTLTGHQGRVTALALAPGGKLLASGGSDNVIRLWNTTTGKEITPTREPAGPILSASVSPDGKELATVSADHRLSLWAIPSGRALPVPEGLRDPFRVAVFRPDGRTLGVITAPTLAELQVRDRSTGKILARGGDRPTVRALAYSPDGSRVATVSAGDGELVGRDGKTCLITWIGRREQLAGLVYAPDGRSLLGIGSPAAIPLWTAAGKELRNLAGHRGGLLAGAWSPDSRLVLSGGHDRRIRLWELASGLERWISDEQPEPINAVAVTPNGRFLVAANRSGLIRVWSVATGRMVQELISHRGPVTSLQFAERGQVLISTGSDTTILYWSLRDLPGHELPARSLNATEREVAWQRLKGTGSPAEVARAGEAIQSLVLSPTESVAFLDKRLTALDGKKILRLLEQLDHDTFAAREQAMAELALYGRSLESVLEEALKKKPGLEKHRRLEELLRQVRAGSSVEHLRLLRGVEVLERIGTRDARAILERLSQGMAGAELTEQARAAFERSGRPVRGPS